MKKPKVQIYLSCLNEGLNIQHAIKETEYEIKRCIENYELIVVDNGSDDETPAIVQNLSKKNPNLRLLQLSENMSYAGSIFASITDATSQYVIILDGDLQFHPKYISIILSALEYQKVDIVFIRRTKLIGDLRRRVASILLLRWLKLVFNLDLPDINGGMRGMTVEYCKQIQGMQSGRLANLNLWYAARKLNMNYTFIDVEPKSRKFGKSTIPWNKPLQLFQESLEEIAKIKSEDFDFKRESS